MVSTWLLLLVFFLFLFFWSGTCTLSGAQGLLLDLHSIITPGGDWQTISGTGGSIQVCWMQGKSLNPELSLQLSAWLLDEMKFKAMFKERNK